MLTNKARFSVISGKPIKLSFQMTNINQAVGKETGLTAHVERFNNTLRQRLSGYAKLF